jgi:amidase
MSAQTQNPIFGRTNNPWNLGRTVGGSSGGSAAAVAAGLSPFDVGSDLTGSIRMPAHYCGVFGLKPTAHRFPITGHIWPAPGAMRFDRLMCTIGPLARSIEDLKLVASILAGPDGLDVDVAPVAWRPHPRLEPASLRVAFLPASPGVPTSRSVRITVERVALELERAGARVEERTPGFTIDEMNQVWVDYFALFSSTTLSLFATSLPVQPTQHSSGTLFEWARVLGRRDDLVIAIDSLLSEFDAFLCPAGIGTAFPHSAPGSKIPVDGVEVESRFVDYYTYPFSFTGSPAVVVPAAIADDGLPIGVQLVGKRWADERLLAVADVLIELTGGFRPPPEMESAP